jgi:hypothetical protein
MGVFDRRRGGPPGPEIGTVVGGATAAGRIPGELIQEVAAGDATFVLLSGDGRTVLRYAADRNPVRRISRKPILLDAVSSIDGG